jgi:hypothetical protein
VSVTSPYARTLTTATLKLPARGSGKTPQLGDGAGGELHATRPRFVDPRWELGASIGPRISDAFTGAGLVGEWRRRIGGTRWHLGIDFGVVYATGVAGNLDVQLGGVTARGVIEVRFSVAARVAILLSVQAGAVVVGERRAPPGGAGQSFADGGPAIGGGAGLLARMGPGVFTVGVSGAWTPLIGIGRANLDGGVLTAGYRFARF